MQTAEVAAIDAYVDANATRFIEEWKEILGFPSISVHGAAAVEPCRDWLEARLRRLTDSVSVLGAGGLPSLLADIPGVSDRCLLLYSHYDVQPVDPLDLWTSPPFQPTERDGRVFARGAADDKDDVVARLQAIETMQQVSGGLPLRLKFLCEGEEEVGSPSFEALVEGNRDRLAADGCLWEPGGFDNAGRPEVYFGCRGLLYVDLRVKLLNFDQHSSLASLYPSAAMYLIEAIHSLRDLDMHIRIDGFYDDCVPPSDLDRQVMARIDPEIEAQRNLVGFDRLVGDPAPEDAAEQLLFTPTCNVAGISAGYSGPGSKTVLPAEASAKLDFRLIPNQDPRDLMQKLRRHLDRNGFERVEIATRGEAERPARSALDSAIGQVVVQCVGEFHGQAPVVWPFMQATGPMYPIAHSLGIPTVGPTGSGRPDARVHAPDENTHVADHLNSVKLLCRIFAGFAHA